MSNAPQIKKADVRFSKHQVELIEQLFPEVVGTFSTPSDELRYRSGQRSVVHAIKARLIIDQGI